MARQRGQRAPSDALEHDADDDESEVAIDHAFTGRRNERGTQRELFDVLVDDRTVIGTGVHAGGVIEQHARRDRAMRRRAPLRNHARERFVQRERAIGDELQEQGRDEELGQRREIETRVDVDRAGTLVGARHAVRALEEHAAAMFDARDGGRELASAGFAENAVDARHSGRRPVGMALPKITSASPPMDETSSPYTATR